MAPKVLLRIDDGGPVRELEPGDYIGRSPKAALIIDDPRISEAHALVSLRGSQLKLLALRGRFAVHGKSSVAVALRPGVRVLLAGAIALHVVEVQLPESVLAIESEAMPRQILSAVTSLCQPSATQRTWRAQAGFEPDAAALVWQIGGRTRLRVRAGPDREIVAGDAFMVGETEFRLRHVPVHEAGVQATHGAQEERRPLTVTTRFDSVHIASLDATVVLNGIPARIISELAQFGVPAEWQMLAVELWPGESDAVLLRQKWDAAVQRLRAKLRAARLRADLVRSDQAGHIELFLCAGDQLIDES